jgi:D-glycero-D-manno-heptose 1,7-bisphosphate phosphatase
MLTQAIILAGGIGSRLGDLTADTPKPALDVAGRPFLAYLLWNLKRHGIFRVLLSVGYLADRIMKVMGDGSALGVDITYVVEAERLGTGGGLRNAAKHLDNEFLVLNGDTLFDFNYHDLPLHLDTDCLGVMALRRVEDVSRYGSARVENDKILSFDEKSGTGPGFISGGVYLLRKAVLNLLPEGASSIEHDLFPQLAKGRQLAGAVYDGYFLDIGLQVTLAAAQTELPAWQKKPVAFFDRDGVLNLDRGYVHKPEDFNWQPDAREAVKLLNDSGYLVMLVTNQSGIGRGYYDESTFHSLTVWIQEQLSERGAHLDDVFFCPHHPTAGLGKFLCDCDCRKPNSGMIDQACATWEINMTRSFVVGDSENDMDLAKAAGIPGYLYKEGSLLTFIRSILCRKAPTAKHASRIVEKSR